MPVPLLLYALSRLREVEWLAPSELLPLWKMALPGAKAPEPQRVCDAGYDWGCIERIEVDGASLYRLPQLSDLPVTQPQQLRIWIDTKQPLLRLRQPKVPRHKRRHNGHGVPIRQPPMRHKFWNRYPHRHLL